MKLLADGVPAKFTVFKRVYKLNGQGQIETPGKPVAEHVEKMMATSYLLSVNKPKDKPKLNKNRVHELATTVNVNGQTGAANKPVSLTAVEAGKVKRLLSTLLLIVV